MFISLLAVVGTIGLVAQEAHGVAIDFDDGTNDTAVGAHYAATKGVTFTNAEWYDWVSFGRDYDGGPFPGASRDFVIGGEGDGSGAPSYYPDIWPQYNNPPHEDTPIIAAFDTPVTSASILAVHVGFSGARLEALDATGAVLDSDEVVGQTFNGSLNGESENYILSVASGAGIHGIRFYQLDYSAADGLLWDNLRFDRAQAVPVASNWGLGCMMLLLAGAGACVLRRRPALAC